MIIAYPLTDIVSLGKAKTCYQKQGVPCKVVEIRDNVAILENSKGEKFPANTSNIVWADSP